VVPACQAELSAVHLVPLSAVHPPLWSLMQEPRPLRPVLLLSRLRHLQSRVAALRAEGLPAALPVVPGRAAVPQVVPGRAAVLRVQVVRVQVVLEQAVLVRAVPVAVPRRPVVRVAEPPPEAVRQAALRAVPVAVPPWVAVRRWVAVPPPVAVRQAEPRSRVAHLRERPWWTRPVCLPELRWWTRRWSDL
jgi:hypothetical protein